MAQANARPKHRGQEPDWSRDGRHLYYLGPTDVMEARFETEPTFRPHTAQPLFDRDPYIMGLLYDCVPGPSAGGRQAAV